MRAELIIVDGPSFSTVTPQECVYITLTAIVPAEQQVVKSFQQVNYFNEFIVTMFVSKQSTNLRFKHQMT